ncbi:MAG: ubiE/COQ5 methyltransferase family [Candidatus Saccharibacteria bacterium]|nr:ubiE/COQ5 methyltransferase family [Candidatus Saccharibacteria bacterium]
MTEMFTSLPRKTKAILEIGSGRYESGDDPTSEFTMHWSSIALRRTFRPDDIFIGVDMGSRTSYRGFQYEEDDRMRQNWATIKAHRPDEQINYIQANAMKLPFADDSFDEVIASNVFAIGSGADRQDYPIIYDEANRVLKPDGTIVIYDNLSPYFAPGLPPEEWMVEEGFVAPVHVDHIDPVVDMEKYMAAANQYGLNIRKISQDEARQLKDPREEANLGALKSLLRDETIWRMGKTAARIVPSLLPHPSSSSEPKKSQSLREKLRSAGLFKR